MQALRTAMQLTASMCAHSSFLNTRTQLYFKVLLNYYIGQISDSIFY